jgi:hypothetical protein
VVTLSLFKKEIYILKRKDKLMRSAKRGGGRLMSDERPRYFTWDPSWSTSQECSGTLKKSMDIVMVDYRYNV